MYLFQIWSLTLLDIKMAMAIMPDSRPEKGSAHTSGWCHVTFQSHGWWKLSQLYTYQTHKAARKENSGRKKRCRFPWGFLGCSNALDLCVLLIAFRINHRYGPRASVPVLRCVRKQDRRGAQRRRGTSWQLCVWFGNKVHSADSRAPAICMCVKSVWPEKNEWCRVTGALRVIMDLQRIV